MLSGALVISVLSSLFSTTYATITSSTLTSPRVVIPVNSTTEVFTDSNFSGNSTTINENVPLLEDPFQDSISSLIFSEEGKGSSGLCWLYFCFQSIFFYLLMSLDLKILLGTWEKTCTLIGLRLLEKYWTTEYS